MDQRLNRLYIKLLVLFGILSIPQKVWSQDPGELIAESIAYYPISSDTLYASKQEIHILEIQNAEHFEFVLSYSDSALIKTSDLAIHQEAIAAINGGFFDVRKGGSVNYLEFDNQVINWSRRKGEEGAISPTTMNGIVYGDLNRKLMVERARKEEYYADSDKESFALITGPMLIEEKMPSQLPGTRFVNDRHPRSGICWKPESVIFLVVDGRSESAAGMSLPEVQELMVTLGCVTGINLDGGGSSTLWIWNGVEGKILNKPSDKTGERKVANAILVRKKN